MSLTRSDYLSFRDDVEEKLQDSEVNKTISEVSGSIFGSLSLSKAAEDAPSKFASFGIGIGLALLGQYLATKKRGSRAARVIAKIFGADVDAMNRDFVLAKLKDREYYNGIQQNILQVLETKSIDEFAQTLGLTSGEAWEVYRQIKDMVIDAKIIDNIAKISSATHNLGTSMTSQVQSLGKKMDEQLEQIARGHKKLEEELYQGHGLKLLSYDYFETYKTSEKDFEDWQRGFSFKLESIKENLEFRRHEVINDIEGKLEGMKIPQILLVGAKGSSKTTIFYEIICDYYDRGYEILYNEGSDIRDASGIQRFLEEMLLDGKKKILVGIDNAHTPKTSKIFYVIDKIANHGLRKNIRFLLTASIPEFDQLVTPERIIQVEEPYREPISKFSLEVNYRYPLRYFQEDEIIEFYKMYGNETQTNISEENLRTKAKSIYNETKGYPILVKFLVLGKGLSQHVKDIYSENIMNNISRLHTMLVCGLFDISHIPITVDLLTKTVDLLTKIEILTYAEDLEQAKLLRQESQGLWKTLHPAWDVELLSFLYNDEKITGEELHKRKQYLGDSLESIFNIQDQEITSSVVTSLYDIAADRKIPIDIVESQVQIPKYVDDRRQAILYGLTIAYAYSKLNRPDKVLEKCETALKAYSAPENISCKPGELARYEEVIITVWNNKGNALGQLQKYNEAIECFDKALEMHPNYATAWYNKGLAYTYLSKYDESIVCFDKVIEINPYHVDAWLSKGASLTKLGRYEEAIVCFDKVIEMDPANKAAQKNMGLTLAMLDIAKLERIDKALEIDPNDAYAWNNKGNALGQLRKYNEAIECFDKAIEIDSKYADAWYNKGLALHELGKPNEAIECFDKAIEIDSKYAKAWYNKGVILGIVDKNYDEAIECFDQAIRIDSKYADAWSNKGAALDSLGKYEDAIKCFDKVLEIDPKCVGAWYNKGNALGKLGKYEDAIKCFDKVLEIDPKDANAWGNKGTALYNLGKLEEALSYYDKSLEINPNNANDWNNKGLALYNLGKYEEAIACFDKALEIDPKYVLAWNNKGAALKKLQGTKSEQRKIKYYTSDGKPVYE